MQAEAVLCAGRAGVRILSSAQLAQAQRLLIVADVNAVPPSGVEGLDVMANGTELTPRGTLGIGPLAIGNIKYKTEFRLFQRMIAATKPVTFDFRDAFSWHASSMHRAPAVLIAAASGRALAASPGAADTRRWSPISSAMRTPRRAGKRIFGWTWSGRRHEVRSCHHGAREACNSARAGRIVCPRGSRIDRSCSPPSRGDGHCLATTRRSRTHERAARFCRTLP